MEPVRIEHHEERKHGVFILLYFGIVAIISFNIDIPKGYVLGIWCICSGTVCVALCFLESKKVELFSSGGISISSVLKTRFVSWGQVIQIGIAIANQGRASEHIALALTFLGGRKRDKKQTHRNWVMRNESKNILTVPYSPELHQLVLKCYGPLDYDERNAS